jgi:glucose-1-phosphate cytidylyltransferase
MLPIGGRPVLWHVMKLYAAYGHTDFVLALGWLGEVIKEFFLHYEALTGDFVIELGERPTVRYLGERAERGWRVTCVDTGVDARTGTRVRRAARLVDEDTLMVTYGDGLGDVDLDALLAFHRAHGRLATVTAVRPPGRFGELVVGEGGLVTSFEEKPEAGRGTVNGGFMVFSREAVFRYIPEDEDVALEREPFERLVEDRQLVAFEHDGFWQHMDTPRERELLARLWDSGKAPWKVWT